jgi:hypothetical protein
MLVRQNAPAFYEKEKAQSVPHLKPSQISRESFLYRSLGLAEKQGSLRSRKVKPPHIRSAGTRRARWIVRSQRSLREKRGRVLNQYRE